MNEYTKSAAALISGLLQVAATIALSVAYPDYAMYVVGGFTAAAVLVLVTTIIVEARR
jgi:hypothetical protein